MASLIIPVATDIAEEEYAYFRWEIARIDAYALPVLRRIDLDYCRARLREQGAEQFAWPR